MKRAWVQEWEESERGWGVRPDGYTVHRKKEDIDAFLADMRQREEGLYGKGVVPDEYSRPRGEPLECAVDEKLLPARGDNGRWLPSDWRPTKKT